MPDKAACQSQVSTPRQLPIYSPVAAASAARGATGAPHAAPGRPPPGTTAPPGATGRHRTLTGRRQQHITGGAAACVFRAGGCRNSCWMAFPIRPVRAPEFEEWSGRHAPLGSARQPHNPPCHKTLGEACPASCCQQLLHLAALAAGVLGTLQRQGGLAGQQQAHLCVGGGGGVASGGWAGGNVVGYRDN